VNQDTLQELRLAWYIGSEAFRQECLERMEGKVGENHPGQTRLETAQSKAERIVVEEMARLQWTDSDLVARHKSHPAKLALAARLRQETTLSVKQIAERLHLGKPQGARTNLHKFMNSSQTDISQTQLEI
jgi:hypothetical protein